MTTNNSVNTYFTLNTAQELLQPIQTNFFVAPNLYNYNVTGNGTVATITFTTEITDVGSNFDGTSTFTAPATGKYLLEILNWCAGISQSDDIYQQIETSNCTYRSAYIDPSTQSYGDISLRVTAIADMDAADTAKVKVMFDGEASDRVDVGYNSGSDCRGFFQGVLVC